MEADRQTDEWVGAQMKEQRLMGWRSAHPAWFPLSLLAGLGQQGRVHGPSPWDGTAQRGGQCQATPSPPLGMSQLLPDNPRWDPIMSSRSECPPTVKREILTKLAQGDHGRVPTHQGTRKTDAEGAQQHPREGQWTLAGPLCLGQFLKGQRRRLEHRHPGSAWV